MQHTEALAAQIRARIEEIERDLAAHREALAILEGQGHSNGTVAEQAKEVLSVATAADPEGPAPKKPRRRRAASKPATARQVLDAVKAGHAQATAIAAELDAALPSVRAQLRELERAGEVRRSGQGRRTQWREITDEERIAARAAELAARSRTFAGK